MRWWEKLLAAAGLVALALLVALLVAVLRPSGPGDGLGLTLEAVPHPGPHARVLNLTEEDVATFPPRVRDAFDQAAAERFANVGMSREESEAWHQALLPIEAAQGGPAHHYRYRGVLLWAAELQV